MEESLRRLSPDVSAESGLEVSTGSTASPSLAEEWRGTAVLRGIELLPRVVPLPAAHNYIVITKNVF